jgi:serine/threonine protein phosphatase 1
LSKWRPTKEGCLFVIPDIHGMLDNLNLILNRILPLRKSDRIVFLGDYIDRDVRSHKVIDLLIDLKEEYPNQIFLIKGNHEFLFLEGIEHSADLSDYLSWMKNGGEETLLGYMVREGIALDNAYMIDRKRIKSFIPKEHLKFLNTKLIPFYQSDNFIFVHGGCDPFTPIEDQDPRHLAWDRSVFFAIEKGTVEPVWDKTIVTGHNGYSHGIVVKDKFLMLDGSYFDKLYVMEMFSGEIFYASRGNKRLVKWEKDV